MRRVCVIGAGVWLLLAAGCVSVDLGQASKDWAEVGKSFADEYREGEESTPSTQPEKME